jgi:hypothetical protein
MEECEKSIAAGGLQGQVEFVAADARGLGQVIGEDLDAALLMGLLYHLILEADRKQALSQAFDRLCSGGILFSAFISRFGIMGNLLRNVPDWIEDQVELRSLLARGRRPDAYPRGGFRGYFAWVAEIAPLHEAIRFETLTRTGVEPAIYADDES